MSHRPARVRFYIDQDLLGLAKVLATLREDVTYPGDPGGVVHKHARPPSPVAQGALDEIWIPVVAKRGWLIISRDRAIQSRFAEIVAVRDSGAKMVCLSGEAGADKWRQLETFMTQWRRIEEVAAEPGPFIYRATRTQLRPVDLDRAIEALRRGRRSA